MAVPKTREELSDALYVNARAEECWEAQPGGTHATGLRAVMYRGEPYVVVGIYLARGNRRRLALRYVLKRVGHTGEVLGSS